MKCACASSIILRRMEYTYNYKSPVIGLHVPISHRLEDTSIYKKAFIHHPFQKELAIHSDLNALNKSIKHNCYLSTGNSLTKDAYITPRLPPPTPPTVISSQITPMTTTKKMVIENKFSSRVFAQPDKQIDEMNQTSHQVQFTPVSLNHLKDNMKHLSYQDMHAHSDLHVRGADSGVKSEYAYRYVKEKDGEAATMGVTRHVGQGRYPEGVRGPSKLNVTHNTITGDRYDTRSRKIGFTNHSTDFCPKTVSRSNVIEDSALRNKSSSIAFGDPAKECLKVRATTQNSSYLNPSTIFGGALRFDSKEAANKTFKSSFKQHADNAFQTSDAYDSTAKLSFTNNNFHHESTALAAMTTRVSCVPHGDLDAARVKERISNATSKGAFAVPPINSYHKHVNTAGTITCSNVRIGHRCINPQSNTTTSAVAYVPFADQSRQHIHIIPPPKDYIKITTDEDFSRPPTSLEAFQHSGVKSVNGAQRTQQLKNVLDFSSHWCLPSRDTPSYISTNSAFYTPPALAT